MYVHLICNKHHGCKFFIIICREYNQPNLPKHAPCKHNNLHDSGLNSDVLPDLKFEKLWLGREIGGAYIFTFSHPCETSKV